jgi:phosphatidylserine/phosphatidylglycerophosphate/cardiolipin synthase-like enzyme
MLIVPYYRDMLRGVVAYMTTPRPNVEEALFFPSESELSRLLRHLYEAKEKL